MPETVEWPCQFPECMQVCLYNFAICDHCYQSYCILHREERYHACCRMSMHYKLLGGFNINFPLTFDDGVKWLLRLLKFIHAYTISKVKTANCSLPTEEIGCILPNDKATGACAGPIITRGSFMSHKPPYLLGPLSTLQDRYTAHIDAILRYLRLDAIASEHPVDEYLWHLEIRELVLASSILARKPGTLYIRHDDEKGDHMLFDDCGGLVGVIDWEWAFGTTKGEAFAAPYIFWEDLSFMRGNNKMTKEEEYLIWCYEQLQRPDLADCVRQGRLYQRLTKIGQYGHIWTKKGYREVFAEDIPADFHPPSEDPHWRVYMIKRYRANEGLQQMMMKGEWSIERAEHEAAKYDAEKVEAVRKKKEKNESRGEEQ
ncbi:hypothetical protein IAU60_002615 [Kwoniella sp. DSM 27419]